MWTATRLNRLMVATLAKFQAIEGKTWNQPALAQGKLIVRNEKWMACFDLAP